MAETFRCELEWSGARQGSTASAAYNRELDVSSEHAPGIPMSAAGKFRGDDSRWNPEQLLVASLSACQALTYLHLASTNDVEVVAYGDSGEATLGVTEGKMRITRVTLRPRITLGARSDLAKAESLVAEARAQCFVSNSVSTRIAVEPQFTLR